MKKKILFVTERRADYSKLKPIISQVAKSSKLDYFLIVTGSHLLKEHGMTINEIKKDGFKIESTFSMFSKNHKDTSGNMANSFGKAIINLSKIIEKLNPDIVFAGFDIGANFAAAIVGAHMNILVAHLEGGEVSGTIDESIRHATTKFAHMHFTTNKIASERLIKMGENPKFIYVVGNPSLDNIKTIKKIPKKILAKEFSINFSKPLILLMQHTVTSEVTTLKKNIQETIDAIHELDVQCICILGNNDAGSKIISKSIKKSKIKQFSHISFKKYINLLRNSDVLIGNSSSGIMEAPFLHVPSINIGTRQFGRVRSKSIIDVDYDKQMIKEALLKSLKNIKFQKIVDSTPSFYGDGCAAKRIVKILEDINLKSIPIQKQLSY